ncbi:NAD-dependent epimerase/dehydratase family protein [Herbiconiux sp. VKM Ac-2851]|jgi:nucleoside-diphosphate-sugar epimerase|uniref:NAD-dependent epimerase/dehydratase family protein n=1 Tax=Herbiconiux sp. VKM Ac-2851 TaxID=2739025 RepID=UPI0015645783|nr:NAD-dependent epimerase/dehydratase family protein [Herbiconiux sp. VKM Ac-2851]NQX36675.1 NAD-dependent epimerase/dehydratase family protein [Herbiconiux sp. VKM Ac-2851]
MAIFLTGATGFIGSAVLRQLREQGRDVVALVRSSSSAAEVEALGARAVLGELTDREIVTHLALESDGVIHLASPGDESSAPTDDAFVTAVLAGLEGSDKPYVHTSGIWIFGNGSAITETSPFDPPALTSWRLPVEARVRSAVGVKTSIIAPGIVFGNGGGIPNLIVDAPRGSGVAPALELIGSGEQHWTTVFVDDLAELYILAFDLAPAGSYYIGASGQNPTVRELGEAAAQAAGLDGRVEPSSVDAAHERLGEAFADALLLDQQATGSSARIDLGWEPNGPSLVEELRSGSYVR